MGVKTTNALSSYASWLIRKRAQETIGRHGFTKDGREDLEQELALHVFIEERRYDSTKSTIETFDARIVDSKLATIIERQKAAKRTAVGGVVSFDAEPKDDDDRSPPLYDTVSTDNYRLALGTFRRTEEEQLDLDIEVRRCVDALPPGLRRIAALLSTMSVTEAAAVLKMPRSTLDYSRRQIGREFTRRELDEYL